jgi:hypothetical protein
MKKLFAILLALALAVVVPAAEDPLPFSTANPVVFNNDWSIDAYDLPMCLAMASAGTIDLRGIVACITWTNSWNQYNSNWAGFCCSYQTNMPQIVEEFNMLIRAARYSGYRNIPDAVPGPHVQLTRPANTNIDETLARTSIGTTLILTQAQAASASLPLVVVAGGMLTAPVSAYLLDTNIASKMIIAWHAGSSTNNDDFNGLSDSWAAHIALQRLHVVVGVNNNSITNAFPAHIPEARMGSEIGNHWLRKEIIKIVRGEQASGIFFGPFPWEVDSVGLTLLMEPGFAVTSKYVTFGGFMNSLNNPGITHLSMYTDSGSSNRYRVITTGSTNLHTVAWWRAMTNQAAFWPKPIGKF